MNLIILNHETRPFGIRVIRKGEHCCLSKTLVHDKDDPLVEFWDLACVTNPTQDFASQPGAQFVRSYYASTVSGIVGAGLDLHMSEPVWKIDAAALTMVQRLLRRVERTEAVPSHGARIYPFRAGGKRP